MSDVHFDTITKEIAEKIHELHDEFPDLGHEGIGKLLEDAGVTVDEYELRIYMDEHHMDPGPTAVWKSSLFGRFKPFGWGLWRRPE